MIVGAPFNGAGGSIAGRAYVFHGADLTCGDANGDGLVTHDDLNYLINFYFLFGEPPLPCNSGDVNDDGLTDISDIVYLGGFLNNNGPAPCAGSEPPPLEFDPKEKPEGRQTVPTGF